VTQLLRHSFSRKSFGDYSLNFDRKFHRYTACIERFYVEFALLGLVFCHAIEEGEKRIEKRERLPVSR